MKDYSFFNFCNCTVFFIGVHFKGFYKASIFNQETKYIYFHHHHSHNKWTLRNILASVKDSKFENQTVIWGAMSSGDTRDNITKGILNGRYSLTVYQVGERLFKIRLNFSMIGGHGHTTYLRRGNS